MTMDHPPPKPNSGQNEPSKRKRRKKRKSQKKKKNNSNKQSQSQSQSQSNKAQQQAVHLPHAKVTIRNIQNSEKFSSVESVVELLRELIRDRNEIKHKVDGEESAMIAKIVPPVDIVLDEKSVARILERDKEQKAMKLKNEQEGQQESKSKVEGGGGVGDGTAGAEAGEGGAPEEDKEQSPENAKKKTEEEAIEGTDSNEISIYSTGQKEKVEADPTTISARVLYMIPPRKSRRRGELPGHCYLALVPPMPSFIVEKTKRIAEERKQELVDNEIAKKLELEKQEQKQLEMEMEKEKQTKVAEMLTEVEQGESGDDANANGDESSSKAENEIKEGTETVPDTKSEIDVETTEPERKIPVAKDVEIVKPKTVITASDRSRALAQCRLLLIETVAALSNKCKQNQSSENKSGPSPDQNQSYKGIQIEMSPSQKIWKTEEKGPRKYGIVAKYDATIEQNDDYKKFNESKKQAAENLMNRPKPPPGGGQLTDTMMANGTDEKVGEGGDAVALIVLDLLEKKAAAKRAKKKAAADKKKVTKSKGSEKSNKMSSTKTDGEKKKKRSKKKSKKKSGDNSSKSTGAKTQPKVLLKKS